MHPLEFRVKGVDNEVGVSSTNDYNLTSSGPCAKSSDTNPDLERETISFPIYTKDHRFKENIE